jgi:hypothetical protein
MKQPSRREVSNPESRQRGLRLSKDVIRTLTAADLARAVGGSCETGSLTTDGTKHQDSAGG